MLWLGEKRGYFLDWFTQRWVQLTGRRVSLARAPWLAGPIGSTRRIGPDSVETSARASGLSVRRGEGQLGILPCFAHLRGPHFEPAAVSSGVRDFYEKTSAYELDAWSEWCTLFRPWGRLLAALFTRRLQQLNVPLSGLDTGLGITSDVFQLVDPATGQARCSAWIRQLVSTGNTLYAGTYGVCRIPGHEGPCVRVIFPLPNGNAMVLMRPRVDQAGSLSLISSGERFGDPGFYFTVQAGPDKVWARYVRQFRELITVYPAKDGVRADHTLTLWGARFLRMHYRMRRSQNGARALGQYQPGFA